MPHATNRGRYLVGGLIFAGFVALVQVYFGWAYLLAPWAGLPPKALSIAALLVFASYWVRAVRLYDYFRLEMRGAFRVCFKLMLQHNLLNNLLPMRTGEISFPVLMARYFAIPVTRSVPVLVWFRLLDLHVLLLLALLIAGDLWLPRASVPILLLMWLSVPYFAFIMGERGAHFLSAKLHNRLAKLLHAGLTGLPPNPLALWRAWVWSLVNWLAKLGAFAWIMLLFIDVPTRAAWLGVIAGDLTSVLPIHGVAGAGTYEAGVMAGLLPFNIAAAEALKAAINVHLFLLGSTLMGGAISLALPGKQRASA